MLTIKRKKTEPNFSKKTPKSNLKAGWGIMKGKISEKNDCWEDDLKKTVN